MSAQYNVQKNTKCISLSTKPLVHNLHIRSSSGMLRHLPVSISSGKTPHLNREIIERSFLFANTRVYGSIHGTSLGSHHLISGGWGRIKLKKIVCRHKSQKKKFVENVGKKKSLLSKLMKNMLTRQNTKW